MFAYAAYTCPPTTIMINVSVAPVTPPAPTHTPTHSPAHSRHGYAPLTDCTDEQEDEEEAEEEEEEET